VHARRWFDWHSWVGLTTGLLLFVICWSGSVAVFSEEIDWLLIPAKRVTPAGEMKSFGDWQESVARAYPHLRIDSISAPQTPNTSAEVLLETAEGRLLRTYVNPYTAEVTGQTSYFNVQRFFRSLHMSLFDPGGKGIGYYVVMSFSFALVASLTTSLLFYKRWWQRFFAWKTHPNRRAFWSDTHKLCGLWSLWFVALMAVTGLWYLIEFAGVDFDYPEIEPTAGVASESLSTDALIARARQLAPELRVSQIYLPGGYYGPVAVMHGEDETMLVRDRANVAILDASNAAPMLLRSGVELGWPARWVDTADPLHFGNFGGLVSKTIWFVFGTILSGLCLTGAYLHLQRQKRTRAIGNEHRRAVLAAYAVTCLVLIAAVIGAVQEIARYGAPHPPPSVGGFIATWTFSTILILFVWMRRLR